MNNPLLYLLMFVSAFASAVSQVLLKISADKKHKNRIFEYLNPYVILSYACYFGILALNVFIYTKMDYRFGVVINSAAIIFVMLLSRFILKEKITKKRIIGNIIIIAGVICFTLF